MSRLTDLIAQAKAKDSRLGADLDQEFKQLSSRLPFGLNFERHRPEAVELPQRPVRKGDKVRVLPLRGSARKADPRFWQVKAIHRWATGKVAELELLNTQTAEVQTVAMDDLVVVAEFRDMIYLANGSFGANSLNCFGSAAGPRPPGGRLPPCPPAPAKGRRRLLLYLRHPATRRPRP